MEDEADAILWGGVSPPPTPMLLSKETCADPSYLPMRLKRMALAGLSAAEADAVKKACDSARAAQPSEKRRAHGLMQVEPLRACGPLDLPPQCLGQSHRPDGRRPARPLDGAAPPQQDGVSGKLRHFPEGQQGRPAGFSSARECIPA
jgi:hypothetical protein